MSRQKAKKPSRPSPMLAQPLWPYESSVAVCASTIIFSTMIVVRTPACASLVRAAAHCSSDWWH